MSNKFEVLVGGMSNANCSSIFYDDGQLQIAGGVRGGETLVRISFASALLVRIADEGLRLQLLDQLGGSRGSLLKWSQSELIDWVSVESVGTKCDGLQHFTVLLGEEIVDVITADLPKVEFAGA